MADPVALAQVGRRRHVLPCSALQRACCVDSYPPCLLLPPPHQIGVLMLPFHHFSARYSLDVPVDIAAWMAAAGGAMRGQIRLRAAGGAMTGHEGWWPVDRVLWGKREGVVRCSPPLPPPVFSALSAAEDATATMAAAASLPGSAADVYRLWGPTWAGEGAPPLVMTVEVAAEAAAGGGGAKSVRAAVDMDAHARALARCVIEHAPAVSTGEREGNDVRWCGS